MKILAFVIMCFLTSCATKATRIPDTANLSTHVNKIGNATTSAQQSAQKVDNHINATKTDAQRIDDKAVVVLHYWH